MLKRLALSAALLLTPAVTRAIPYYQLDIQGGHYDSSSETIVTEATHFTLYAYVDPRSAAARSAALRSPSYLSIALDPAQGAAGADLGSFTLNGQVIRATGDMRFGTPPFELDGSAAADAGDLASHGLYPTFFTQERFRFGLDHQSAAYDTALNAGSGPRPGTGMLYAAFELDTSALAPGVTLHFDLFSTRVRRGDTDILRLARSSYDAGTIAPVSRALPEPSTALLFGIGLLAAAACAPARSAR